MLRLKSQATTVFQLDCLVVAASSRHSNGVAQHPSLANMCYCGITPSQQVAGDRWDEVRRGDSLYHFIANFSRNVSPCQACSSTTDPYIGLPLKICRRCRAPSSPKWPAA